MNKNHDVTRVLASVLFDVGYVRNFSFEERDGSRHLHAHSFRTDGHGEGRAAKFFVGYAVHVTQDLDEDRLACLIVCDDDADFVRGWFERKNWGLVPIVLARSVSV